MSAITSGYVALVLVFILIFFRMPIAMAFALVGIAGLWFVKGLGAALGVAGLSPYATMTMYVWTVAPCFITMGYLALYTGLAADFYNGIRRWIGHLRGGLAMTVILGNTAFGACTGDPVSAAITFTAMSLPEMRKFKYADSLTLGSVAAGGQLAALIPPSIGFIVYGAIAEVSIGQLFIAGIIPGILLALLYIVVIYFLCRLNPQLGPPTPKSTWNERMKSGTGMWGFIFVFGAIIGGIFLGLFTPTEAGAFGVLVVFVLGLARKRLSWQNFKATAYESSVTIGMVGILLIGCLIFNKFLAVSGTTQSIGVYVTDLALSPMATVWIIVVVYIILGMFIDALSAMLLTIPIFYPIAVAAGVDPVHFGVIIAVVMLMGNLTPPFGIVVYAMYGTVKDVSIWTIFRGALPFMAAFAVCEVLVVFIPQLSIWLPSLMVVR